ncbi:hypothetical protein LLS1_36940 [Leifsonia sp. LS1]|nr:hypothetical protein LLS1_36940 [Leifsonia sp. LS1]
MPVARTNLIVPNLMTLLRCLGDNATDAFLSHVANAVVGEGPYEVVNGHPAIATHSKPVRLGRVT